MDKLEVQKRITKEGIMIPLKDFNYCEITKTISAKVSGYCFDFGNINYCTIITDNYCTIITDSYCTIISGTHCTIISGIHCTIKTGIHCTIKTGINCNIRTGCRSIIKAYSDCIITTGGNSTIKAYSDCIITTGGNSTITTGGNSTIRCDGINNAVINQNVFEVLTPKNGDIIQICPNGIKGHLVNGLYEGHPHIIADNILSKIISKKSNVYKVINHGEEKTSYLVRQGDVYSHGETLKEAKESLIYKITERNLDEYKDLTSDSEITFEQAVSLYRGITGACSSGTQYFVEQNKEHKKDKYKISELLELTKGQFGHKTFVDFFN